MAKGFKNPSQRSVKAGSSRAYRSDRTRLTETQRSAAYVEIAALYVFTITDYRGFDPKAGWRHGVVYGADLPTQLALNAAVDRASVDRLLSAVAAQAAPAGEHSYRRCNLGDWPARCWWLPSGGCIRPMSGGDWLSKAASPAPLASWNEAFNSRAGLAKRHNVHAFFSASYVNAREQ